MDKPKLKDGMLAAGKKRLEQFRQKKQGKGSSSKQNKQETGIELDRSSSEVENASRKSSTAKSINDSEGIKAKGSRMHTSSDDQEVANNRFGDDSKVSLNDGIVERVGDGGSPIRTEHNFANAIHAEGNTLEQRRVSAEELPAEGNGELCLTIKSLDSSQLHPSSGPSSACQLELPLDEDCSHSAGAPDLSINMADLVAPDFSRDHNVVSVEHGTSEPTGEGVSWSSPNAFQACDKEQQSSLESCPSGISPCSSYDYSAAIATEIKSDYGDEMQANHNTEDNSLGSRFNSPMVPNSLLSTSGGDEEETSQPGDDFLTSEGGMIPGSLDGLENVVQRASKKEEPTSSYDYQAVIATEIKSEYGDEMQANYRSEDFSPGSSFSSPMVPNSLLSISEGDEGDTSRAGLDFVTREGGMIPGSLDGLENIVQGGASKEEEPCLSSDYPAVIETKIKSEYGNEMQANYNTQDISPGSSFSSPMVPNSLLSTSGGDEGDTSRAGHDFVTREGGMILGSTDGLENVIQGASKEEEPCSSSDFPAVIATEIKSEYGDEMQANHNTEDIPPGASFSTPLVPDSLLPTSGGDEGDTSRAGHDFVTREGGLILGFMDVSENLVHGASKEEEPCSSAESKAETNSFNESTPEPKVNFDTDVVTTPCSEVDTSLASQTPSLDNDSFNESTPEDNINFDTDVVSMSCSEMDSALASQILNIDSATESHSSAILVSSVLNESCSLEQSQTVELDVRLVEVLPDSSLDHKGLILINDRGFKGSEDASVPSIAENATELHSEGIPNESSAIECCDSEKPQKISEWAVDSCSKPTIEEVGDACTGSGSLKHEVACNLDAKRDSATVKQGMDDVISGKLEADSLSPPPGDELKSIEKVDVCHHEPDLESNFAESSELFSNLEHVLSAQVTSKFADYVELQDPCRSYEAVSFLVDEVPLVMNANKALEKESDPYVPRSLLEDLDTDSVANHNRNTRTTVSISGMDSMNIDDSSSPSEVGQDIQDFDNSALPLYSEEGSKDHLRCKGESTFDNSDLSVSSAMEENKTRHLEELLLIKDSEIESLQKLYAEEREGHLGMRTQASALADKVTALLGPATTEAIDGDTIGTLDILVDSLHAQYESFFRENKDLALRAVESDTAHEMEVKALQALVSEKEVEKVNVEGELKHMQDRCVEQEIETRHLEELLSIKDSEIESLQKLYAEEREGHSSMRFQTCAFADKVSALLGPVTEAIDGDTTGTLDILAASLRDQYEAVLRENKDLALRAIESDAAHEMAMKTLQALISEKEVEKANVEGELKYFQDLCVEQESKTHHLEELLWMKDTEIESLQKLFADEREGHLSMRTQASALADKVTALCGHATESIDCDTIGTLDILVASLHEQYEAILRENKDLASRVAESNAAYEMEVKTLQALVSEKVVEKVNVEGVLKQFQDVCVEQESQTRHLEELLLIKDTEIESFQKLYAEEREGHLSMRTQAIALADKVTALLSSATEVIDGDTLGTLDMLVASLHGHYEDALRENKDLALRAIEADEAHEMEVKTLQALVSEKELELGLSQEKVDCLTEELNKTKEDWERKLLEAEQKALGVRERLSLAVTKGKGLVQQRDNLKQMLAEKIAEVEALVLSYQQELHAKTIALNEAESKAKLNAEASERVEALESELSYIRNSANALRESFLQKDAVLQKIEELLEDASLPEELQIKDTYEKVEYLLEASHHKTSNSDERASEIEVTRDLNPVLIADQASHIQDIEQLNRKCDEYVRKYRGMAEELAMLEQSLLERNLLIQRWEEMLDNVDMPASVRSKEPEDRIQWLATAVSDANNSIDCLQADTERLHTTIDTLNHSLQKLQQQNAVLSAELVSKEDELRAVTLDFEDMTRKFDNLSKPLLESTSNETSRPVGGTQDLQVSENNPEESQQQLFQIGNPDVFITKVRMLMSEVLQEDEVDKTFAEVSTSEAFESSMKLLVEKSKFWYLEATETDEKLSKLTLAMRKAEEDNEKALQNLHEALSSKTGELNKLNSQLEGFAAKINSLEDEVDQLQKELKVKTEELSFVRDDLNKSQLEVSQGEEKLASVREKLSMAVKKGKSVVQQRDTLKHSLDEKVAELDQLRKDYEAESVAFTKAKQSFKNMLQELEAELSSSRKYVTTLEKSLQENNKTVHKFGEALDKFATSGAPRSGDLLEKIQWTSQLILELQRKAGNNEQEAKKSKKAAELLALELEEVQGRMDSLADELVHAEKTIFLLTEEKKVAEASKAEAGLRLEHAMANVNSLLFELREYKEAQENLEQENSSLKDSLATQMEEIRFKHTKTEELLKDTTDLYNKVHALKANQSNLFGNLADEILKLSEDMRGTKNLIVRMSGELKEQGFITLLAAPAFVENFPSKWEPEYLNKGKASQEWKQGVTASSIRLLCEEMEMEFQHFDTFFSNNVIALTQDSAASSQLLLELCNGLGSVTKKLETLKRDADFASSSESSILQKDEQIRALEEVLKVVAEMVRSSVEEVEGLKKRSGVQIISPVDGELPVTSMESVHSLVERLISSVKDLAQSCQQVCIESEKQNEELRCQLREAKDVINAMGQHKQLEKLKLQKCLEEFEGKDDILKRTNQELCSLHDILTTKNQEEKHLLEALEKAESKMGELSIKVEELEKAKQELEASLGKASSRFYATVDNFNKFRSLSEKLIEEAEGLHLLLEDRDAQVSLLKDEVAHKASEVTDLQSLVNERTADLCQVYQQIGGIVNRDASDGEPLPDPGRRRELLEALATSVRAGSESLRVQLARKDALLQDIQLRHDDMARKVFVLESTAQENLRLMEERGANEHMMITVEAEEKGNRGKHATPSVALVTHGRAGRKVSAVADHSALDVDAESGRLLADVEDEDKGHVFKPLTSSRLVPRGTRIVVDRLDGLWVSGERLLRRRPGARLSVMLYWLLLHMWMVASLL